MPRGVFNWTFDDVVDVLKSRGFRLIDVTGSHHHYAGVIGGRHRLVQVPLHGRSALKPRTFKSVVTQSGIPLKEWSA
jgi:predicted RNA binding protein YcfA (HicA-like mRNA interferase family)